MKILMLVLALSLPALASKIGSRPTDPGRYGEVVNCDDGVFRGSDGWAKCWAWNYLNNNWERNTYYCPHVGCDRKVPPDDDDR
jgi:hypothetical protein